MSEHVDRRLHTTSCLFLSGSQLYCRKCDSFKGKKMFERNNPRQCWAELLDAREDWSELGELPCSTAAHKRAIRHTAYRIIATRIGKVHGKTRRIIPKCCSNLIKEAGYGESSTGFTALPANECSCNGGRK